MNCSALGTGSYGSSYTLPEPTPCCSGSWGGSGWAWGIAIIILIIIIIAAVGGSYGWGQVSQQVQLATCQQLSTEASSPQDPQQFFGMWYSQYCSNHYSDIIKLPDGSTSCILPPDKQPRADIGSPLPGLMTAKDMIENAQAIGLIPDAKVNSTASLGVGSSPSYLAIGGTISDGTADGTGTGFCGSRIGALDPSIWDQVMCKMGSGAKGVGVDYNVMNIGGWGGGRPVPTNSMPAAHGVDAKSKTCPDVQVYRNH